MERHYSPADRLLMGLQQQLARLTPAASSTGVEPDVTLDESERRHAAGLMRVNHAGEVAAQGLYQGQALTARDPQVRDHLLKAAEEEQAHLRWCEERLSELGEKPSRLQPLWHAGSLAMGALAGLAGDKWSLGFVEETEKQVAEHLDGHLQKLPESDARSREIVERMKADEERHGQEAADAGAKTLPLPVRALMRRVARVMTKTAYWI
ncbi:MAG: 2-polyprenyl-3-methyl-6-methoxy-1,4-benzoquinone monooxygenase [Pseudomonadota bacterium]